MPPKVPDHPAPDAGPDDAAPRRGGIDGLIPAVPDPAASAAARPDRRSAAERRALDRRVMAVVEHMSDAFLALGPDWRVTYANHEAARLNGTTPAELVGHDHWEAWPETRGSEVEREYRRAAAERVPVAFEHFYPGAGVWHDIRVYPADDGGLAVFYRDITAQKRLEAERARQATELAAAHEKALAAEAQFRLLVDRVRDYAVILLDPDGIITHWGEGARRIGQWDAQEVVGRHLRVLYPANPAGGSAEDHIRHAAAHGEYIGEELRVRKDGEHFPARVVLTALHRGGQLVGFSEITQDLTGERERQAALEAAMHAAQAANVAKSQFVANTSHEIRTPLNAIMGYAELLDVGLAGELTPQQRQYVARIQGTSRHLLSLINDVLDLSRIEAGHLRAVAEHALAGDVAAEAIQLVAPQVRARGIALANGCDGGAAVAYRGDPERVRQVLVNLLSNALRFTERGGRITVTCGSTRTPPGDASLGAGERWTFVRVEDTGVGIPPEQLERIWDAFVQVDASRTRRVGGSGLGLTISRHLARLMGGDVTVTSQPGLGSAFTLWLPAAEPSGAPPRPAAAEASPAEARRERPEAVMVDDAVDAAGLTEIGDGLVTEVERIVATHIARLRSDPGTPSARGLGDTQLEDHTVTFLTDVAQCLTVVAQDGPAGLEMLRDGSAIQRLIAVRHGAQRAQLGWTEEELRREHDILREEVHAAIRRQAARADQADVGRAIAIANHFIDRAEEAAAESFRGATGGA